MSIAIAQRVTARLPYALREQVLGCARSVDQALPEIQAEAMVTLNAEEQERLILVATLRKLHGICSANFWAVENAGFMLARHGTSAVRIGGTDYTRGEHFHMALRRMLTDLEVLMEEARVTDDWLTARYIEVARWIADGRT